MQPATRPQARPSRGVRTGVAVLLSACVLYGIILRSADAASGDAIALESISSRNAADHPVPFDDDDLTLETVTRTWNEAEPVEPPLHEEASGEATGAELEPRSSEIENGDDSPETADSSESDTTPRRSAAGSKYVTIDGADDGSPDGDEPVETDPLDSGLSLRWLMRKDGFGITDLELSSVDHRPRFPDETRWNIHIPFAVSFVDEPQALGIPSELYSVQIETRWLQPIGDQFGFDISVIPGWFSDFDAGRNNGFRVAGHGMATLKLSEEIQLALGAMYLGRDDVKILPAGGLVWWILPDTRLDLLMPKPRIAQRVCSSGGNEHFVFAGFELFGGNSWAVTRPDNSFDTFSYRDFRFVVGHEAHGPSYHGIFEIGYVFARKLQFRYEPQTLEPGGTLLIRLGSAY